LLNLFSFFSSDLLTAKRYIKEKMKILNKYSVFTALASTKYAICIESGLRHGTKLNVMQDSFVTNGIERSVEGSHAENIEIGPQGLGGARDRLLEAWNRERSEIGLDNLELSGLANQVAKNMADQGTVDPSYANTCYGVRDGWLAGTYNSVDSIIEAWFNSEYGAIIMDGRIRFTGIGIAKKSSSEMYAVGIFCSFDFVKNLEVIGTGSAIRESMLSDIKNERQKMGMDQITETNAFQFLAETWAKNAAKNNEVFSHNQKYRRECQGIGGEVGAVGHSSEIRSLQKDAVEGYLANGNIRYMGIGIAIRNDGAAFSYQLFCSFKKGAGADPGQETWAEKVANFIISKENVRREEVVGYTEGNYLKTSSVSTKFAQEWANKLKDSATISEDPDLGRGCGAYAFQIVATGSNRDEIWGNIVHNEEKVKRFESLKTKFVGTGVVKNSDGKIILVQNFCTWKPVEVISME